MQELAEKEAMKECSYCVENKSRIKKYEEDLEREKTRECLKALEREKIANGMHCTKNDEMLLREMQKEQMREKKKMEQNQADVDIMWHRVLLEDVRIKEEQDGLRAERLKEEMLQRRLAYDEQISSASRRRRDMLQHDREIENRRLEKMKNRMEQDYWDAIRRKKDQQLKNRLNYLEGYNMKISRMKREREKERDFDMKTVNNAMEELRLERQKKIAQIRSLKMEKEIFIDNHLRERKLTEDLGNEIDRITTVWKEEKENEADDVIRNIEEDRRNNKIKSAQEYKNFLEDLSREKEIKKQERKETAARVKETAYEELLKKMDDGNKELRKQINYRQSLSNQIQDNNIIMKMESNALIEKQRAFTKTAVTFKDAMKNVAKFGTNSENPIHPFKRAVQKRSNNMTMCLPFIKKND